MNIYDKISKMADESGTYDEKMYLILSSDKYSTGEYQKRSLGEGMEIVNQVIWGWWKPRFLLNHNLKTAYEWMWPNEQLAIVEAKDIDWESMKELPEDAIVTLKTYSFKFPSFIRHFKNGIAEVQWQLIPDGRYWMDDDGFGMTSDNELNIYGFIDQMANVISRFRYYTDKEIKNHVLERVRCEAEETIAKRNFITK